MDAQLSIAPDAPAAPLPGLRSGTQSDALPGTLVRRHRLSTRLWHWLNVLALTIMVMSGLMIFNAHPRLYWGSFGANPDHPWLEIRSLRNPSGALSGRLRVGPLTVPTTGVLGVWKASDGSIQTWAFPGWATIPSGYSLADARRWHLAFAWLLAPGLLLYLLWSLVNGHLRRDLAISRVEAAPRHVWQDIKDHARLRFPTGAAALRYNVLQKVSYGAVLFVLLPLIVLSGMALSPGLDSALPLTWLMGGRASARSVHFLCMAGLVGFIIVHVVMVLLAGPINELRSMITGWYRLPGDAAPQEIEA